MRVLLLLLALQVIRATPDPFAPLAVYSGTWKVVATHPWGGGPAGTADILVSLCTRNTAFFTCEQTVNGKPTMLIVYVSGDHRGEYHTKNIFPSGLSANRGDLTITGENDSHFTYLDKGQNEAGKPAQYRVENDFKDADHIHFVEYESTDDGNTWNKTNEGSETRTKP